MVATNDQKAPLIKNLNAFALAAILSIIETFRRLKFDVRKYLKDVLHPLAQ
jgi:hypothetical protein